jgi:hypothetical protein
MTHTALLRRSDFGLSRSRSPNLDQLNIVFERLSRVNQAAIMDILIRKVLFVYSLISCVSVLVKGPEKEHF